LNRIEMCFSVRPVMAAKVCDLALVLKRYQI
jgi:hypothetical protein